MVTIQVDEQTALALEREARNAGVTVAEFVRSLVSERSTAERPSWDEIERQIIALSTSSPALPPDFCRADIYADHD